jgi:arabinofuranan 3-O-arabinosyltransferase
VNDSTVKERPVKRRRAWWMVTPREARHHAIILAVATWGASLVITLGGSGSTSLVGVRQAPDFIHFYTFGLLARHGRIRDAYDWQVFHAEQVALVPESADAIYPPVYPPQAAVMFIPVSALSLDYAVVAWTIITILTYGMVVWRAWLAVRGRLPDGLLVGAAAVGFAPFWQVVMNGQVTIIILLALFLAWLALERRRAFFAGMALGLLAIKPQFGLPFAAIVLVRRDWSMMAGAVVSVAAQAIVVWWGLGDDAFLGYGAMVPTIAAHADELEPKPFQSHSIRAVTRLLPEWLGVPLWVGIVGWTLWRTSNAWATPAPLTVRLGLAILASVLVNPHLIVYDAAILVLPLIWFGAWIIDRRTPGEIERYGALVYGLFLTFLAPTAAFVRVQLSVFLMLGLFWWVERGARRE